MANTGSPAFEATLPAVATNPGAGEHLVVWSGSKSGGALAPGELEIFAQRIHAGNGAELGPNDVRVSDMGGTGDATFAAFEPAVAYNPTANEYLVVWVGNDSVGGLVAAELEVFVQRIDAVTGLPLGANDRRISDMGGIGAPHFEAYSPSVAYNPQAREYLVVWQGEDDPLAANGFEIYGQRLAGATAAEVGANDFRISDMGSAGEGLFGASSPRVVFNPLAGEYLVVWAGADRAPDLAPGETEIYVQRLSGATAAEVGFDDLRISDMGGYGSTLYSAASPTVAFNAADDEYLVAWVGSDDVDGLVAGELEVFVQRLDGPSAVPFAINDVRVSDMGGLGDPAFGVLAPTLSWDGVAGEYLLVWSGDDDTGGLVDDELELFAQRLSRHAVELGPNDERLGAIGGTGDAVFAAVNPVLAYNGSRRGFQILEEANPATGGLAADRFEIFGLRFAEVFANGFESGDVEAWASSAP
jgi:hypothetical protein